MSLIDETTIRIVLYEGEGAEAMEPEFRFSLMSEFLERGYSVTRVSGGEVAPADRSPLFVLGRFADGKEPPMVSETSVPMRVQALNGDGVEAVLEKVELFRDEVSAVKHGGWKPWFPVIDYDRCTNCMQCLSFCLFDVYGVSAEQELEVHNNDNCKTNCPACSRVCPEAAIMFPKYKAGPINGEEVKASDMQQEKMKVDISSLLGGDIYSMLRQRTEKANSRFAKERSSDKALTERQKCLVKLATSGDIPPEVLMSLPSPDEIQRRAVAAKAKAEAALNAKGS